MEKMECYHQLANAIVLQAVKDYQEALRKYYKGDRSYYGKMKSWFLKKYPNYAELDFAS